MGDRFKTESVIGMGQNMQGLWSLGHAGKIPWPQCHNPMNSMRGTSDQGTMENGQSPDLNAITICFL
jgi:hypothetical protein